MHKVYRDHSRPTLFNLRLTTPSNARKKAKQSGVRCFSTPGQRGIYMIPHRDEIMLFPQACLYLPFDIAKLELEWRLLTAKGNNIPSNV